MGFDYCYLCMSHTTENKKCPCCGESIEYEAPVHHLKPGTVLRDKYLIGKAIGEGGFGITYMGRDLTLDMKIAVKEYYPNGISNRNNDHSNQVTMVKGNHGNEFEKEMQRFLSEARILARFCNNPGVVGVRDFFRDNGTAYIVMEFLDGITLKNYLKKYGPIPPVTFAEMIDPILLALHEIHNQGLIHRDISPDNIMMLKNGQLKLLDFGAAREVAGDKSLSVMLKPGYAPEEQYRSKGQQGSWTDVYAMCATIYKCITGITPDESIQRVFEDDLKKPSELGIDVPPSYEQALMQGLSVKSTDRIQTIDILRRAISAGANDNLRNVQFQRIETPSNTEDDVDDSPETEQTLYKDENKTEYRPVSPETENIQAVIADPEDDGSFVAQIADISNDSSSISLMDENITSKNTKKIIVIAASCLAALLIICSIFVFGGKSNNLALGDALPSERTMAKDCSTVLKERNVSGGVLNVDILDEDLNERFKTYVVTCETTVADGNTEKLYTIMLRYEYDDEVWKLSDLSSIK